MYNQNDNNTMNMFKQKTHMVRNYVPITLKMIQSIDPYSKRLQRLLQINKAVLICRVISINPTMNSKHQIQVKDQTSQKKHLIFLQRPKFLEQDIDIQQGEYYKFICLVKSDHGEIVLNVLNFHKITNFNEITFHKQAAMQAYVWRQTHMERGNQNEDSTEYDI